MEINYVEMGKRIRVERKRQNLTQEMLAESVDVAPSYISEIERGKSPCSLTVLARIAMKLELDFDYLIVGINENNVDGTFRKILHKIPTKNQKLFVDLCDNIANVLAEKWK